MNNEKTQRSSAFLIANLGAEVSRMYGAKEKGDSVTLLRAHERARKIFDEVALNEDMKGRLKEIEHLVDAVSSLVFKNSLGISRTEFDNYFNPFALRVLQR